MRTTSRELRLGLATSACLAVIAGLQLYVGTEQTETYFAWTIEPPLTAAFLGGTYWGALVMLALAARERVWAAARVATLATLLLVTLLLIVTLVHISRFHTSDPRAITLAGTWAFIAAYIVLPSGLTILLLRERRRPGSDPPRLAPLPGWARAILAGQATALLLLGALLLAAPGTTRGVWPWHLTDLTGRAVGAWLLACGVAAALGLRENDWWRLRVPFAGYVALAVLQGIALARYPDTPDWSQPQAWLYLAFLASMLAFGAYGLLRARRAPPPAC